MEVLVDFDLSFYIAADAARKSIYQQRVVEACEAAESYRAKYRINFRYGHRQMPVERIDGKPTQLSDVHVIFAVLEETLCKFEAQIILNRSPSPT